MSSPISHYEVRKLWMHMHSKEPLPREDPRYPLGYGQSSRLAAGLWGLWCGATGGASIQMWIPLAKIKACKSEEELIELYETEYAIQRITGDRDRHSS